MNLIHSLALPYRAVRDAASAAHGPSNGHTENPFGSFDGNARTQAIDNQALPGHLGRRLAGIPQCCAHVIRRCRAVAKLGSAWPLSSAISRYASASRTTSSAAGKLASSSGKAHQHIRQ